MDLFAALLLGGVIGASLGAIGGGGSILTVPALVYLLGEPARAATTDSLVIVGVTALAGVVGYARADHVRWNAGVAFGLSGVAASFAGTAANRAVRPDVLLLLFAALMLVAAAVMYRRCGCAGPGRDLREGVSGGTLMLARRVRGRVDVAIATKIVAAGLGVGFLTGFLGVGGGFIVVPVLVMTLRLPMPDAVGTSLLVIALNSTAALVARAGTERLDWTIILPFGAAAVAGSLTGRTIAARLSERALARAFVALLVAVALYTGTRSLAALR